MGWNYNVIALVLKCSQIDIHHQIKCISNEV